MNPDTSTNNHRLRELIAASGKSQPEALKMFNRGLGAAAYSFDSWKAFLVARESKKYRKFNDKLLKHAEKVFAKVAD